MTTRDWNGFDRWHLLFDALCTDRGHYDGAALASELCRHAGRGGERDHLAAERNLRNWRLGKRLPLRRNVSMLARILQVDSDPGLRERWDALYRLAATRGPGATASASPSGQSSTGRRRITAGALLAAGAVAMAGLANGGLAAKRHAEFRRLPTVHYNARVVLAVGASRLIHGAIFDCSAPPPEWYEIEQALPRSRLGVFGDAGPAKQLKRSCNGEVAVRAIRFTAQRTGDEEHRLLGSYLRIEVVQQRSGS